VIEISTICNIISAVGAVIGAVGTVGAVVVALWLASDNKKPKLTIGAYIVQVSGNECFLCLYCTNTGLQPIQVNSFGFCPSSPKGEKLLIPANPKLKNYSENQLPKMIKYSESVQQLSYIDVLREIAFKRLLGDDKSIAKKSLEKRWKVTINTNIKEFQGKLSKPLIDEIIDIHFNSSCSLKEFDINELSSLKNLVLKSLQRQILPGVNLKEAAQQIFGTDLMERIKHLANNTYKEAAFTPKKTEKISLFLKYNNQESLSSKLVLDSKN